MAVKIIITRKVPKEKEKALLPLLLELRALATVQPGYISGETLRNVQDPEDCVVISTWRSVEDWNAWVGSKKRAQVQGKIDSLLRQNTAYGVYLYG